MRTTTYLLTIILVTILLFWSCSFEQQNNRVPQTFTEVSDLSVAGFCPERLARIDSLLEGYIRQGLLPNAVTFVARNGKIIHHKAYGFSDIESGTPLKPDDIFRIASQTKAITTAALMTLYEEGMFLLDDPLSKYIPEFRNPAVLTSFNETDTTFTTRPAEREITIRHLLNHTSGIHYGILGEGPGNMMFAKEGIPAVNSMDPVTIGEIALRIARMPLLSEPGERYLYGMNTDIAGYLIEILSGKPLDVFLRERILKPLGMNDTWFYLPPEKAGRLVTLYTPGPEGPVLHPNETYRNYPVEGARMFFSGGAGLSGPVEDYARFLQMMINNGKFNGNRILSRKTIELMTTNQIGNLDYGSWGRRFGLGFDLWNGQTPGHHLGSEGAFKWGGLYYTDYLADPEEGMILLFYTNIQPYRGPNIHETFHNLVYQALE